MQIGRWPRNPEPAALSALMGQALMAFLSAVLPLALGMMVVGTLASAAQGGVTFATKGMKPTLKKLNPFPGIKRMFGTQGLWEATKALIKTARPRSRRHHHQRPGADAGLLGRRAAAVGVAGAFTDSAS